MDFFRIFNHSAPIIKQHLPFSLITFLLLFLLIEDLHRDMVAPIRRGNQL